MESDKLYRVKKEDLPKLEELLNICFAHDPLYETLIPDPDVRKRLMPELFHCDMDEFYETCEIFADSEELNSVLVVSDETESYNLFHFLLTEAKKAHLSSKLHLSLQFFLSEFSTVIFTSTVKRSILQKKVLQFTFCAM